jgi:nitrate/nitrite-specific signal transduction histidine kinase
MNQGIHEQLQRLAEERRELERKYVEVEKQNSDLTNLFVASKSLHESLDRRQVLAAIQEIIINLLGSEELAVFELNQDGSALELVDSFGVEAKKFARIPLGDGSIGQVAAQGQPVVDEVASRKEEGLTACVPLMLGNQAVGAVAVFRLLPQKQHGLQQLDHDLLELLRAQAGLALYCTRLVQKRAEEP